MKIFRFLRSMKFGLILLSLIILLSLVGSFLPQGKEAAFYQHSYGEAGKWIVSFHLHDVFSSVYFIGLLLFLGINLIFCSILRVKSVTARMQNLGQSLQKAPEQPFPQTREQFEETLKAHGFRYKKSKELGYYTKNTLGYWGSFLTHLAFLLILVFGGAMLYFSDVQDVFILPGESGSLKDGTVVYVDSFQVADDHGHPDYRAQIRVANTQGKISQTVEISVNNPFSFGGHTFYQQSFATAGSVGITYQGDEQQLFLTEPLFFSPDGINGFAFAGLQEIHGLPMYRLIQHEGDARSGVLAAVGDHLSLAGMDVHFHPPVPYPGIRAKITPPLVLEFLYVTFFLMIAALYLSFFHIPSAVLVKQTGYALIAPKSDTLPEFLNDLEKE